MARPAPIRLAGTIAATATLAVLATEAAAQSGIAPSTLCDPQTGAQCSSTQVQTGDVTGLINLDVSVEQLQVSNVVMGNALTGGIEATTGAMRSHQTMTGSTTAETELVVQDGRDQGSLNATTQSRGNYFGATTQAATFAADVTQVTESDTVRAQTVVRAPNGRLLSGGSVDTAAVANTVALGGPSSVITGSVDQTSQTGVFAATVGDVQYIPAPASFSSQAIGNVAQSATTGASHQDLSVRQTARPSHIEAQTDIYVDNGWNLAARAHAVANQTAISNAGGSLLVDNGQSSAADVRAATRLQSNLQGESLATATAIGNEASVANLDIYLRLDNSQLNTGGVEASTLYGSVNGYDSYVGANAAGNAVTAYGCASCGAELHINNNQTNHGNVSATTGAVIQSGRAAVVGSNAVGNTATFYVSQPGN